MEKDLKKVPSKEVIEIYTKTKDFVNFLDKEIKNMEKMRDTND